MDPPYLGLFCHFIKENESTVSQMPSKAHFLVYQYTCTSISYSSSRICFPTHAMYTPLQPACITPGFRKPWNIVKKTLKAIFHEFLHKNNRSSSRSISHEQRISCSHRHPYKPLPPGPGSKYQFDFFSKLSLTFWGHSPLQACSYLRTILDFLVNYTLACRIYLTFQPKMWGCFVTIWDCFRCILYNL